MGTANKYSRYSLETAAGLQYTLPVSVEAFVVVMVRRRFDAQPGDLIQGSWNDLSLYTYRRKASYVSTKKTV